MIRETISYFKRSIGYVLTILLCNIATIVLACTPLLTLVLSSIFGTLGALLILFVGFSFVIFLRSTLESW